MGELKEKEAFKMSITLFTDFLKRPLFLIYKNTLILISVSFSIFSM